MSEETQDNQEAPEEVAVPDKFKNADGSVNNEALIKSYTDLEKDRSRVVSEIDTLKKELDSVKSTEKLAEGIEKIVANTTPKEEEPPSYEEYMKTLASDMAKELGLEEDDPSVVLAARLASESAKASSTWIKDTEGTLKEQLEGKIAELNNMLNEDKSQRIKSTPEYRENKAQIDELVEAGMDEGNAIKFVLSKVENTSDVSSPPPSTPSGRVTAPPAVSDYWDSPEEREQMVARKGEDAVIAMEATYARRLRGE